MHGQLGMLLTPGQEGLGFRQIILQSVGFKRSQPHTCLDWCAWQAQLQVGVMGQSMIPLLRTTQPLESPDAHRPSVQCTQHSCAHALYMCWLAQPPILLYHLSQGPNDRLLLAAAIAGTQCHCSTCCSQHARLRTSLPDGPVYRPPVHLLHARTPKTGTCKPHSTPDSRTKCSRNMLKMLPSRQVDDFAKTLILPGCDPNHPAQSHELS